MKINELEWPGGLVLQVGSRGPDVLRVQEWLVLRGQQVKRDGDFGPKTQAALRAFQVASGLPAMGDANAATFASLSKPMADATAPIDLPLGSTLGSACVAYARKHLAAGAQELAESNLGPWVRLYMDGRDGREWPWCAGFVSFVIRQAAATTALPVPFRLSFGCTELARYADAKGRFLGGSQADARVKPGSVFVIPKEGGGAWSHTGFVVGIEGDHAVTIEGNTSVGGSREGTHVKSLRRPVSRLDFLLTDKP